MTYDPNAPWFSEEEKRDLIDALHEAHDLDSDRDELIRKIEILATRRRYDVVKSNVAEEISKRHERERQQRQSGGIIARP